MNRQQKRVQERKSAKLTSWINSLSLEQERAITMVIDEKVNKRVYSINQALDTSVAAALNTNTDLSIKEIEEILIKSNEYLSESENFLKKWGDEWIMKLKEIEPKIKEESLKLLDTNINQADAVKVLREKFKDIPIKDLVNIFKESKEEYNKVMLQIKETVTQGLKDIQEGKTNKVDVIKCIKNKFNISESVANNIYSEVKAKEYAKTCPSQYMPNEVKNKSKLEVKESSKAIPQAKENKVTMEPIDKASNTFEVVEKKLKFKGEYYDYEKDKIGLKVGSEFFRSLEDIEAFRKREEEEFEKMIIEIRAAFNFEG